MSVRIEILSISKRKLNLGFHAYEGAVLSQGREYTVSWHWLLRAHAGLRVALRAEFKLSMSKYSRKRRLPLRLLQTFGESLLGIGSLQVANCTVEVKLEFGFHFYVVNDL